MNWLLALSQIALVVLVAWLVMLAQRILDELKCIERLMHKQRGSTHHHDRPLTNYSTWTFRDGVWELVETRIEVGFIAGEAPRRPGAYEGETVRRPAVRSD